MNQRPMSAEASHHSQSVTMGRRRLKYGLISASLSLFLGFTVHASAAAALKAGVERLVYFVLPDWGLIFCAHLVSGMAAATALTMLLPPLIGLLSRIWLRRLVAVLLGLAVAAATLLWFIYALGIGLNATTSYATVTAENGEKVLIKKPGFDPADYSVYRQKSLFVYQRSTVGTSVSDVFEPDDCRLTVRGTHLLLTCGADKILVPPLD